ncbi:MAG TPA: amidase [Acidimicrobiales bacterium]|nr:amidase [Acidimicrobiales bacterium]
MIRSRAVSSREVVTAFLDRIAALNPAFNAIISRRPDDEVLREADAADRALLSGVDVGALHGLPHAIKDTANTAGIRSTYGSPLFADQVPHEDGLAVGRVRRAGAIFIGKTNVPELGLGSHTYNPIFGATGNAWNPAFSAGGSSGGAAVAVAQRMLPMADGSDLGGSLRNPGGWNNVFGFRPSQGRVPSWPRTDAFFAQLVTEGPIARCAADLALLLGVQSGPDPRAPLSLHDTVDWSAPLDTDLTGRKVAWLADLGGHLPMETGVLSVCEGALTTLADVGLTVEAATPQFDWGRLWRCFVVLRQLGLGGDLWVAYTDPTLRQLMKPELQWELSEAAKLDVSDVQRAIVDRTSWYDAVLRLFDEFDYLALPSAQVFPFPIEQTWPKAIAGRTMDSYHRWMEVAVPGTLSGCPVVSIPAGFGGEHDLPIGLQMIGRPRDDWSLLELVRCWEQLAPWVARIPPGPR